MTRKDLEKLIITAPNPEIEKKIQENWDHIAKPLDSLGTFESYAVRIGAINEDEGVDLSKRALVMICADNGVIEEGVSQSGSDVTLAVAEWMGQGISSVCKMAKVAKTDTFPIDLGIKDADEIPGVRNCKIAPGTRNFAKEAAMTEEEALAAIQVGMDFVREAKEAGYKILATGEMGIGNTTTSAALLAALLGKNAEEVAGRGAGLSNAGLEKKCAVINAALKKYNLAENADAFTALCAVGGFDLAGLVGVFLGGALYHLPIVIDGVISAVAALTAERICPGTKAYAFASHRGKEQGVAMVLEELGMEPVIDGKLALGEGSGAVMLFSLLDVAMALYWDNLDFEKTKVAQYERLS